MTPNKEPKFLIKKFMSILKSAFVVESATFLVTLVDSLTAGNLIGPEAISAVGIVAPLVILATAVSSIVNSGTMLHYSYSIGKYDKENANRIFSQGVTMALIAGCIILGGMILVRPFMLMRLALTDELKREVTYYWNIIMFYICLDPLSCLLDNTMISEGGERVSAWANVTEIIGNIFFSVLFGHFYGVEGIAFASLLCKIIFLVIVLAWFFLKDNVSYKPQLKLRDSVMIIEGGVTKASTFAFTGIMGLILNRYMLNVYGNVPLVLLSLAERFMGMTSVFLGLSMASQALMGTLRGEDNNDELLFVARSVYKIIALIGLVISLMVVLLAPLLIRCFGLEGNSVVYEGTMVLRMIGASLFFHNLITYLFAYYYFLEKKTLAIAVSAIKDLLSPVICGLVFSNIMHSSKGLFIGLAISPIIACIVTCGIVLMLYGKKLFPFLIEPEADGRTLIYNYEITDESAVELSKTIHKVLQERNIEIKRIGLVSVFAEEMLVYTKRNNPAGKKIYGECVLIIKEDVIRIIFRDSGCLFDVNVAVDKPASLRAYLIDRLLTNFDSNLYIETMGYNRNEVTNLIEELYQVK